ncbi:MAG: hypothetical protein FWE27_09045 [Defluviitaleaceae bacterium]|nr:hypothetical protein [Defluviitaleaceae bacterium]
MNKNSIEEIYKNAFENAKQISHEKILEGVNGKMKNEPTKFRKKTFTIILAACFLLFSTVAVAQAIRWGSFDWLTERLDNETVERLQPIGLGLTYVNANDIYSIESITTDDVRVELIAVGADDNELDIYILLEDLTESRVWGEEIMVGQMLRFTDPVLSMPDHLRSMGRSVEFNVIERDDNARTAVFHSRMQHPSIPNDVEIGNANTRDLTLFIDGISFDHAIYQDIETSLNLVELLQSTVPTRTITLEETETFGAMGRHRYLEEGELILLPRSLNFSFEVEGYPMKISALGVIDGRLHIQIYGGGDTFLFPTLQRNGIEMLDEYFAFGFRLDENNDFVPMRILDEHGNWLWMGDHQFVEFVFEVDLENLHEYQLICKYLAFQDSVTLNWAVSFELQNEIDVLRLPSREEMIAEHEALLDEIFGGLPRHMEFFDENGNLVGMLISTVSRMTQSGRGEIEHLEISVYFNSPEGFFCVREEYDSLPPEFRDEIIYQANLRFALEDNY